MYNNLITQLINGPYVLKQTIKEFELNKIGFRDRKFEILCVKICENVSIYGELKINSKKWLPISHCPTVLFATAQNPVHFNLFLNSNPAGKRKWERRHETTSFHVAKRPKKRPWATPQAYCCMLPSCSLTRESKFWPWSNPAAHGQRPFLFVGIKLTFISFYSFYFFPFFTFTHSLSLLFVFFIIFHSFLHLDINNIIFFSLQINLSHFIALVPTSPHPIPSLHTPFYFFSLLHPTNHSCSLLPTLFHSFSFYTYHEG